MYGMERGWREDDASCLKLVSVVRGFGVSGLPYVSRRDCVDKRRKQS